MQGALEHSPVRNHRVVRRHSDWTLKEPGASTPIETPGSDNCCAGHHGDEERHIDARPKNAKALRLLKFAYRIGSQP